MNRLLIGLLLLIPQDTLQVKVSLVTVGARVTDSRGRHVTGLKAEDFSVFDDGVAQKIEFFSSEEQPITLGILLDHSFSMSYNAKLDRAKEAARTLVHTAREGSEYFYLPFDDQVKVGADFTTEREKVDAAIQRTNLGGGTSLYDAILQGLVLCGQAQLPRQALVIISDGADQHSKHQLQELLKTVRESQLQIYTIGYFDPEEEKLFRSGQKSITLIDGREIDNPRDVLATIAHESGGAAFFPRSDAELTKAIEEITGDIRTQYTVAFYPKSSDKDTRYHQLQVAVRGNRYTVQARPGYGTLEVPPVSERRDDSHAFESKIERRNSRVFYHDDFSDASSGWPNRQSAKYARDGYRLEGTNVLAFNGPIFRDFRATVSVSVMSRSAGAGLIFRQNDKGFYSLAVFSNRFQPEYLVALQVDATRVKELDRWALIGKISLVHKIEVHCERDVCSIYEQGVQRGQLKNLGFDEGRVGLYLSGQGIAVFHDLSAEEIR